MPARRVSVLLAAVSASVLLLTGCSGDDPAPGPASQEPKQGNGSGQQSQGGADSGGSAGATVSAKQLLGKQDLPPGAKIKEVQLGDFVSQNVSLMERVVTKPAVCAKLLKAVYAASGSDKHGLATAAQVGQGQIVQTVGKADRKGITALRNLVRKCPSIESTVDEQKSRATYRKLDTSKLDAEQAYGVLAVSRISGAAKPTRSVQIMAIKNGLGVSLTIAGHTGASPVAVANKALAKLG